MAITITSLHAVEILDSRGRPTLSVTMSAADDLVAAAGVPSGASTGSGEAVELRDDDPHRYGGKGVLAAVGNVNGTIADALVGQSLTHLAAVDELLCDLDGSANKSNLGANAIVGVSMASARLFALEKRSSLWSYLAPSPDAPLLPVPYFNVVNGGAHALNGLDFQEFMIAPIGAPSFAEAVQAGAEVYGALRARLIDQGQPSGLGDEGGFAPDLVEPAAVLDLLVSAITDAGYALGADGITIALDPAASEFHTDGDYVVAGHTYSSGEMVAYYEDLVGRYPITSIEDGLAEDDWDGWTALTGRLGEQIQLVGDDNFVTNPAIITDAVARGVANAALIKVNQVGTVTQSLQAMAVCRDNGYAAMVSHRSGETPDTFIADLAVGSGCGQIKSGAPARGERVAKYNRISEIEQAEPSLGFGRLPGASA